MAKIEGERERERNRGRQTNRKTRRMMTQEGNKNMKNKQAERGKESKGNESYLCELLQPFTITISSLLRPSQHDQT